MGFKVLDKTKSKWLKKMNKSYNKIAAYTLIKWSDVFREYKTNIIHRNIPNDSINLFSNSIWQWLPKRMPYKASDNYMLNDNLQLQNTLQ